MTDAEAMDLMLTIAADTLHYGHCTIVGSDWMDCDCTAYSDVAAVVSHLVSK